MSTQEIIRELMKLNPDELAQVDLKLHELLQSIGNLQVRLSRQNGF